MNYSAGSIEAHSAMPAPRRNLELTQRQLTTWLQRTLAADDLVLTELRGPSETGFSSDTLLFEARWTDGAGAHHARLVARFKPSGFTVFPTYDMAQQFTIMHHLGRTDVPVPRMRWLEADEGPLGAPFYVMDRVDGRVPSDNPPYHVGGWLQELMPSDREALWWSGLDAMARVHRLDWRALGFGFLDQPARGTTPLAQQLHEYDAYVRWGMERERYPLLERAERWLHAHRPADEPVAVCWGDSRLGNQIFDGTTCVAVIDWEMARLGDPVQDLAWWIALDRCFSEGLGVERLAGLPDPHATIARWESLVGRAARHFAYYEVLALYKFTAIMARVSLQLKHYEIFPADSDMDVDNLASATLARTLDDVGA
jgi:aminoglycoside phosphotransferase (APT) family kinase protein